MPSRLKIAPVLVPFFLLLLLGPAPAQENPLQISVDAFDGAEYPESGEGRYDDPAIRVVVTLKNLDSDPVHVTLVSGTFFSVDGTEMDQDQTGPLELEGHGKRDAILYYANPSSLYQYRVTGTIEYEQDGQTFREPFDVDNTEPADPNGYDSDSD